MNTDPHRLQARFVGALLGTFVGDALGMPFEGTPARPFDGRMHGGRLPAGSYTDDTEMAIALAEALAETRGRFDPAITANRFLANYNPERGYGGRIHRLMSRLAQGEPWPAVATDSWGNGAAMRVGALGAFFYDQPDACAKVAELQATITHTHPLGITGAIAQAAAIARALGKGLAHVAIDRADFIAHIAARAAPVAPDMAAQLRRINDLEAPPEVKDLPATIRRVFPCDVSAIGAVPAALAAFLMTNSFEEALIAAVSCGGDTDTVAAMTGAIAGAYYGASAIPPAWTEALENGPRGRDYVIELGMKLTELK